MIARRSRRVDGLLGDHKVVHFIVLDNVSDPKGMLGDEQLDRAPGDDGRVAPGQVGMTGSRTAWSG